MTMNVDDRRDPFPAFRTQEQADALLPAARAVVDEVVRRLPTELFRISPGTLFVGRSVPEEVACFAAGLVGFPHQLVAVEFELGRPFEETVASIVSRLHQWREHVENV